MAFPQHVYPGYIFGLHEPGGEGLMLEAGRPGWVLALTDLGANPASVPSVDYSYLSNQGLGVIVRLNHGYGSTGTLPPPPLYPQFAETCAAFVARSSGCHRWIIGNEPNHEQEWPNGQPISPDMYARAYQLCRDAIRRVSGHEHDQVLVAGPAPWNPRLGDWVLYFSNQLAPLPVGGCDGFALHTYTHNLDVNQIRGDWYFDAPGFQHRRNEFRTYRDFMQAIPPRFKGLPVYITEADATTPGEGWGSGQNVGWVRAAYDEIATWNSNPSNQPIQALLLYRWPPPSQHGQYEWSIADRPGIIEDFRSALASVPAERYRVRLPQPVAPVPQPLPPPLPKPPTPVPAPYTNQHLITALHAASLRAGLSGWELLYRAGLDLNVLARDRKGPYTGLPVEHLPNLTAEQRRWVLEALPDGGIVNFALSTRSVDSRFLRERAELVELDPALPRVAHLRPGVGASSLARRVARAWNEFGWLLLLLAEELELELGAAVAVLATQPHARGIARSGRLIVRFEVGVFWERWGHAHPERFDAHFAFDRSRPWQGQRWRAERDAPWGDPNASQSAAWAAFERAAALDEEAAGAALSMGIPRLLGATHALVGYASPETMREAFQSSEGAQVVALFDLIAGPGGESRRLAALRAQAWEAFATLHAGAERAGRVAAALRRADSLFHDLLGGQPDST